MSNISINQASKLFKVSRNTIYARIKKGEITKNSDGNVSVQDMMRLFGNKADKKATEHAVTELLNSVNNTEQLIEQPKSNNEQLLQQKIEQLEGQVEQLEKQLDEAPQKTLDDLIQTHNKIQELRGDIKLTEQKVNERNKELLETNDKLKQIEKISYTK